MDSMGVAGVGVSYRFHEASTSSPAGGSGEVQGPTSLGVELQVHAGERTGCHSAGAAGESMFPLLVRAPREGQTRRRLHSDCIIPPTCPRSTWTSSPLGAGAEKRSWHFWCPQTAPPILIATLVTILCLCNAVVEAPVDGSATPLRRRVWSNAATRAMHPRQRLSAAVVAAHNLFAACGHCPCSRMRRAVPTCVYRGQRGVDPHRCKSRCVASAPERLEISRSRSFAAWQTGDGGVGGRALHSMLLRVSPDDDAQPALQWL